MSQFDKSKLYDRHMLLGLKIAIFSGKYQNKDSKKGVAEPFFSIFG